MGSSGGGASFLRAHGGVHGRGWKVVLFVRLGFLFFILLTGGFFKSFFSCILFFPHPYQNQPELLVVMV